MIIDGIRHKEFRCTVDDSPCKIAVQRFTAYEAISQCYIVELWLASEDQLTVGDVLKKEVLFSITGNQDRFFHGVINRFDLTSRNGRFYLYHATLVPSFWFLSLNKNYRIFQDMTVVEIAKEIFKARLPIGHFEYRLIHKYEKRRYCTQYGESDWHFISRIFEEEGIFYFFQHFEDKHILTMADDPVAYAPISGDAELSYHLTDAMVPENEVVTSFAFSHGITPGAVSFNNYNFKRPTLDLRAQHHSERYQEYEVFEYPGQYGYPERGKRLARIHLEEKQTLGEFGEGRSNCHRFVPCCTFTLTMHDFDQLNKQYLLVSVIHNGSQTHALGEQSGIGGGATYSNEFLTISGDVTLRPEKLLIKPWVGGLQSAIVVGPPGEEVHCDEYGRVKVQFHWDRDGTKNESSSCWLRISQPWSGQSWGMISIPRVGDEVLVDFINGDPDWPIVVGSVNNANSPALYQLPDNKVQSGIRTRSYPNGGSDNFHELRFDDRKGREEIYLQSERDWNILVKNDKAQKVAHDESLHVGQNRLKTVGADQVEQIGGNHTETVGASKTVSIGSTKNETVAINSIESVGLAKELSVGGAYQVSVAGAMNETVVGAKCEEVGLAKAVMVGAHLTETVQGNRSLDVGEDLSTTVSQTATVKAKKIVLEAEDEIVLKSGGATISLNSRGEIVIQGATCKQQATGEFVIRSPRTSIN